MHHVAKKFTNIISFFNSWDEINFSFLNKASASNNGTFLSGNDAISNHQFYSEYVFNGSFVLEHKTNKIKNIQALANPDVLEQYKNLEQLKT